MSASTIVIICLICALVSYIVGRCHGYSMGHKEYCQAIQVWKDTSDITHKAQKAHIGIFKRLAFPHRT